MDYIISFISGSLIKLYDDLEDTNKNYAHIELVKTLLISFFTIFLLSDPSISILFSCGIMPACWLSNGLDNEFWISILYIPIITTILTIQNVQYLGLFDLFQRILFISSAAFFTFLEAYMFPEEVSTKKTISRILVLPFLLSLVWITKTSSAKKFIHGLLFASIGYFSTSLIYQNWDLITKSKALNKV